MANISISITPATSDNPVQATITLDMFEWTGLTVNGARQQQYQGGQGIQFQWQGSLNEPVSFTCTADQNIVLVNPGAPLILAGPDDEHSYTLVVSYESNTSTPFITLNGFMMKTGYMHGSQKGPLLFSQGRMTGAFSD